MNNILQIDRAGSSLPWATPAITTPREGTLSSKSITSPQQRKPTSARRNSLYLVPRYPANPMLRRRPRPTPAPTLLQRHPQLVDAMFISVTLGAAATLLWRGW